MSAYTKSAGIKLAASALAAVTLIGGVAHASIYPRNFSFNAVEFMPSDQRQAAAQEFVAQNVTPGMPIAAAVQVLQKAGADCRTSVEAVSCTHASFERHPDEAGTVDVTWKVQVTPTANGTVAGATVRRTTSGF
jgi:hypothetical protein